MNSEPIDWDEDIPVDPEEEYKALVRALRRTQGFGLFFVRCSPAEGERIIQRVQKDLPQKNSAVLTFDHSIEDGNFYKEVENYLQSKGEVNILFIQGLEHSLYDYEETKRRLSGWSNEESYSYSWKGVPRVLMTLNQQRERFRDNFKICFVFLIPLFVFKYLIHRAPDFFDWRSGVFEIPTDPEIVDEESQKILLGADYSEYLQLTPQQRTQQLLEIQAWLEEPYQTNEQKADLFFKQGNLFAASKEYKDAIASFDQAVAIKPDFHEAWYNRGIAFANLAHYEDAIASFDQALAIKPEKHEAWNNRGNALHDLGRYEDAIASFDQALAIKPEKHEAWNNRGNALHHSGRYEDAVTSFDQAVAIQPDFYEAWNNRGISLTKLKRYEDAVISFDQAVAIQPDFYEAWNNRGISLTKLKRYEDAIASYNQALAIQPNQYEAWYNRGNSLDNLGRYEDAIASFDQALAIKPNKYEALYNRGISLDNLGRYEDAIASFNQSLRFAPNDPGGFYSKARCYALLGNIDLAFENLQEVINLGSTQYREAAKIDSAFNFMKEDDRFKALIATDFVTDVADEPFVGV
jgi:tetratricopeptide (TPR) repeat protein